MIVPGGISELLYRARDSFLRWVANRRGIHVPSLVADSLVADSAEADDESPLGHEDTPALEPV